MTERHVRCVQVKSRLERYNVQEADGAAQSWKRWNTFYGNVRNMKPKGGIFLKKPQRTESQLSVEIMKQKSERSFKYYSGI